ncbi:MAG: hypothetical protein JXB49_33850, partial [Bacteroidales bacterium]|nr:hypothetical protein [Bacteroidales bacterium]
RINKPLNRWRELLPPELRRILARLWIYFLVAMAISWLILMEMGIFGYFPRIKDPDMVLNIVFGFLFMSAMLACLTFICAIAGDIQEQNHN